MSKYTTEVRFICESFAGLKDSVGFNKCEDTINKSRAKIFDFDYPIFDEKYRPKLENKILRHFYTREIGEESVGLWKLRLSDRLNMVMPYYNQLYLSETLKFDPLFNFDYKKESTRTENRVSNENEIIADNTNQDNTGTVARETDVGTDNKNTEKYSDTPQGSLQNIENDTYLTNATIQLDTGTQNTNENVTSTDDNNTTYDRDRNVDGTIDTTEDFTDTIKGIQGKSASELLLEFRGTMLNIDNMVIKDLDNLFMQLW